MGSYPDERTARRDIAEAGRRMYLRGYISGSDGNLSARISENEVVATPSGVSKGFMTEDMLVKLSIDGAVLYGEPAGGASSSGGASSTAGGLSSAGVSSVAQTPSSEIKMHLAIYRQSPELRAVCHAHPPVSAAFAAAGEALDIPYLQESVMLLGVIPVAEYALPGSEELADGAAAFCRSHHGVLLKHHGAVTWGGDVMQALYRMESVEYTATVAMYSKMLGFTKALSAEQVNALIAMRPKWGLTIQDGSWNIMGK